VSLQACRFLAGGLTSRRVLILAAMKARGALAIVVWILLPGSAAAQAPVALPRTRTIVEEIGRLEGARDPKCHATGSRLEDLIYGTLLSVEHGRSRSARVP
jgi:hypothetical protein